MGKFLTSVATILLVLCALIITGLVVRRELLNGREIQHVENWKDFLADGHVLGPTNADVNILEFGDYTCRYCIEANDILGELVDKYDGRVAIVYRHFPLSTDGNAYHAALASECAAEQDRFASYHDALISYQDSIASAAWSGLARVAGVPDLDDFQRCVEEGRTAALVDADQRKGEEIGVNSTPTIVIEGQLINGLPPLEHLDRLVRKALR